MTADLAEALRRTTSLTDEALEEAQRRQEESGARLTDVLLELGLVPEDRLLAALGEFYGLPVRESLNAD